MENNSTILENVPAIFSKYPSPSRSKHYKFFDTSELLNIFCSQGWTVTSAFQMKSRNTEISAYKKHLIRLRNSEIHYSNNEIPEIVIVNSHDGSSSLKIMLGIFRIICSNGLIVQDKNFGSYSIRHSATWQQEIIELCKQIVIDISNLTVNIDIMKKRILSEAEIIEFANVAFKIRFGEKSNINAADYGLLLTVRREEDAGNDLWTIMNRIQENCIEGGNIYLSPKGTTRITRKVRAITKSVKINTALWSQASTYLAA